MELMTEPNSGVTSKAPMGKAKVSPPFLADVKASRDLTQVQVRNFKMFMKLLAKYDLWDEMEAELAAQGCTKFLIGAKPMRTIGLALKKKIAIGDLPTDAPGMSACEACNKTTTHSGDAGASKGGGVMQPGTSQNDPVNRGGGDAGTGDSGDAGEIPTGGPLQI